VTKNKIKIAVIGGTGFIGKILINKLINLKCYEITVFSRNKNNVFPKTVRFVICNFKSLKYQKNILLDIDIIINLVTPIEKTKDLANEFMNVCNLSNIKKIIHMSSISVYGPHNNKTVFEDTKNLSTSEYGQNKILFDNIIFNYQFNKTKLIILRPTVVFGHEGKNLIKNFLDFAKEKPIISFLKKSLFYNRSLNLLSVNNLVDCTIFMIKKDFSKNEIFIVSEDQCVDNNFLFLYSQFEILLNKKIFKPIEIPIKISQWIFKLIKSKNCGYNIIYSNRKLTKIGYKNKYNFSKEIKLFVFKDLKKLLNVI